MKKVVFIFLSRPVTTIMFLISIIIMGIKSFYNLPIELIPQIEYPRISVTTNWSNVSPETVEAFLTSPIESVLSSVKGVNKISSQSLEGFSRIDIEFNPETNIDLARLEINEKLGSLIENLPYGVSVPRLSPYIPKDFRDLQGFLTYTLSSHQSSNEIRKYADNYLKAPLLAIDGVANVEIRGGNQREVVINIDFNKAKIYNVSHNEIVSALSNAEQIIYAGTIKRNDSEFSVKISNSISSAEILLNQPVKIFGSTIIRLKDIGFVTDDFADPTSYYRINGKEAVFIEISKEPGSNSIKVADEVYRKLDELKKNFPSGYKLSKEIDFSENIRNEINELNKSAILSFILILIVLFLFFRKLNYSFIILTSIVFSILSTFLFFYVFNLPLNMLTIASLIVGLGIIVDNSIVVVDFLDRNAHILDLKRIAVVTKNIFFPIFASSLTTIAVFTPLVFLSGELKLYLEQFSLAIVIELMSSLISSFTITPVLFSKVVKKENDKNRKELNNPVNIKKNEFYNSSSKINFFESIYSNIINIIYKWRKLVAIILILSIGLPVWLLPTRIEWPIISTFYNAIFDTENFQSLRKYFNYIFGGSSNLFFNHIQRGEVFTFSDTDYLFISLKLPNGNRIERINKLVEDFESEILKYKDNIENLTANVYSEQNALIQITFLKQRSNSTFPYLLKNYLTAYAVGLGGLEVAIYGFGPGFYSGGGGATVSFVVELRGFNYQRLKDLADNFKQLISKNPRIDNVDIDRSFSGAYDEDVHEISAIIDRDLLVGSNFTIKEITDAISKSSAGNLSYSTFRLGKNEVNYTIKYDNYKNIQQAELENYMINKAGISNIKIKDVVKFKETKVLSAINRENQQYIRNVSFVYKGPYKFGNEFVKSSISQLKLPAGYSVKEKIYSFKFGAEEEIQIWNIILVSFVLVYMITSALFESLKYSFLILLTIPFSIIGAIFLLYLGDYVMDRGAYSGMLLLIGLSVNNSILLVDYLNRNSYSNNLQEIINLTYKRVRPIFSTTLTTIAAMVPLFISAQQSFWKSLSVSVVGGMLFSSFFILLIIPILYYLMLLQKRI